MKLTLTLPEVTRLVRQALALIDDTELTVEVITDSHVLAIALRQALAEFPNYRTSQKISAIKRLRELAPKKYDPDRNAEFSSLALIDAKFAVENPESAFLNIARDGRIN